MVESGIALFLVCFKFFVVEITLHMIWIFLKPIHKASVCSYISSIFLACGFSATFCFKSLFKYSSGLYSGEYDGM